MQCSPNSLRISAHSSSDNSAIIEFCSYFTLTRTMTKKEWREFRWKLFSSSASNEMCLLRSLREEFTKSSHDILSKAGVSCRQDTGSRPSSSPELLKLDSKSRNWQIVQLTKRKFFARVKNLFTWHAITFSFHFDVDIKCVRCWQREKSGKLFSRNKKANSFNSCSLIRVSLRTFFYWKAIKLS